MAKALSESLKNPLAGELAKSLSAELTKLSEYSLTSLIEGELDEQLLQQWQEFTAKAPFPKAHSPWCALANGIGTGAIADFYKKLQIGEHPQFGRKSDLVIIQVCREVAEKITVAYGKAKANGEKGYGGTEQVFLRHTDMLFLLHVADKVRVIHQNDNEKKYGFFNISHTCNATGKMSVSLDEDLSASLPKLPTV